MLLEGTYRLLRLFILILAVRDFLSLLEVLAIACLPFLEAVAAKDDGLEPILEGSRALSRSELLVVLLLLLLWL